MSARLTHSGLPEGLAPFTLLNMLDRLRHQLGLGKGEIAYLRFAFTRLSPQDFARGHICAIWYKVGRLADELGLSPRQICRIESALERLGFILRTARHNRSRDGRRAEDGRIAAAWGINFAPLIERAVEIRRLSQAAARRTERLKEDRARITALIREIRDLDCAEALSAARAVLPRLRASEIGARESLEKVISALEAVLADFSAPIGQTSPSAAADENVRPDTKKKTNIKTCSEALPTPQTTPAQLWLLASDGLREAIRLYASALDPGRASGWQAIAMAARDRAMEHGVPAGDWQRSCDLLGEERVSLCLMLVDRNAERRDRYRVRNLPKAFGGMIRREARRRGVADRLLAELRQFLSRLEREG